jgi:hypothetical protein
MDAAHWMLLEAVQKKLTDEMLESLLVKKTIVCVLGMEHPADGRRLGQEAPEGSQ